MAKPWLDWRKIHLGIGGQALEIRSVGITGSHIGDVEPVRGSARPDQFPGDQEIGSVTADGACDTRKCHDAIAGRGAHAVIPPRLNARPPERLSPLPPSHTQRDFAVIEVSGPRPGATMEQISPSEPRRNQMHGVKLLGQRLMVRDFDHQVAELQTQIAVMNGQSALGIPLTERSDLSGEVGNPCHQPICATELAITGMNSLCAGSAASTAVLVSCFTLIETAKPNDVDPFTYLRRVGEEIEHCRGNLDYVTLMPWHCPVGR